MSSRLRRLTAIASTTAILAGTSVLAGSGVASAATVAACQWIDEEYAQTYDCAKPVDQVESVDIIECWSMPPSPRTYVSTKAAGKSWRKTKELPVAIDDSSKDCSEEFPYRTRIRVPSTMLAEMATTRLRLTMPATEGELPDGTPYAYGKTKVTYGVCLMPEDATDWCPRR